MTRVNNKCDCCDCECLVSVIIHEDENRTRYGLCFDCWQWNEERFNCEVVAVMALSPDIGAAK